jgi:hypothetical protein
MKLLQMVRTDRLNQIRLNAINSIDESLADILRLTEQSYFGPDCHLLLDMILEWHATKGNREDDRYQYLWEMWHHVLPIGTDVLFLSAIVSFFSHEILDDGGFVICWEKPVLFKDHDVQTIQVGSDDLDALPVVYVNGSDESRNNPKLLIDAMNEALRRQKQKAAWRKEVAEKVKNVRAAVKAKD